MVSNRNFFFQWFSGAFAVSLREGIPTRNDVNLLEVVVSCPRHFKRWYKNDKFVMSYPCSGEIHLIPCSVSSVTFRITQLVFYLSRKQKNGGKWGQTKISKTMCNFIALIHSNMLASHPRCQSPIGLSQTFPVGDPYNPSFSTVTGWGLDPSKMQISVRIKHVNLNLD